MLKAVWFPWLTVLYFAVNFNVIQASDDREHVHIKVHMPEVVRKHNHYHKVKKHQHHQPHHQPIDVGLSYAHDNLGPQFFPTPLAVLPEPVLVGGGDDGDDNANVNHYAADVMSAMLEGDSLKFTQPYRPAVPPPPPPPPSAPYAATHVPYLRQQLMQQLLAPEIMSVLAGGGAVNGGGGVSKGTNSLLADDFLNELKEEYAKKLQKQTIYLEKLPMSQEKFRKRKKYARDSYQQQQQQQQQQHKQFDNNFQSNNLYDMGPKLHSYQHQQHLQQDFDDDLSDMMEEFDDKSSSEELKFGGESFQDMYAAFTQSSALQHPATTTPTGLNWQPYQQQADHFMLPSMRLATTPYSVPLNSNSHAKVRAAAVTSTQPTTSNLYEPPYKKRKRRIKPKRNHIVVQ